MVAYGPVFSMGYLDFYVVSLLYIHHSHTSLPSSMSISARRMEMMELSWYTLQSVEENNSDPNTRTFEGMDVQLQEQIDKKMGVAGMLEKEKGGVFCFEAGREL
jgi:hypothetical protein